ncbi:MAG: MXAN_2562 family outer membrane beta-barrel protein [Nannocystales bacterium]
MNPAGLLAAALLAAPATDDAPPPGTPSDEALERQSSVDFGARRRDKFKRPGSPQRFAVEIKMGPYLPDIDRKYDGSGLGPYATLFGETDSGGVATEEPKNGLMPVLGFDWQFFYAGGPLGLGTQVAFFRDKASAILANPTPEDTTIRSSADSATFTLLPVSALISYRFELLADRFKVPLVPYAKAGPTYALYWARDGRRNIARDEDGDKGLGGVWGYTLNAGMMLRLDFIERGTAKKLDQTTGINHTYVFGEFSFSRLDNLGIGNSISVGDATWFAGLAIEF